MAIGPGKRHESGKVFPINDIKIGDVVFFGKFSGVEVEVDDETLILINSDDLLGILEED